LEDLRLRLDPDRLAEVLGVTAGGRVDGERVEAFGEKLFTNGTLGVDLLVVPPESGFPVHVHHGHHLLLCLAGPGTFSLAGVEYPVSPGELSMIEGNVPHAVGNPYAQPHVLLAIGAPHRELDSEDRMQVTDWEGQPVLVEAGHAHDHSHGLILPGEP
jgi:quercetin dioxygenase-like cupin family protein